MLVLLRRGAILWLLVRIAVTFLAGANLLPPVAFTVAMIVGALGLLDARLRNEHRFLANLGVSQVVIVLLSMIPALIAELVIGIAVLR